MDKFDLQIVQLKPTTQPARLNKRQFTERILQVQQARRARRILMSMAGLVGIMLLVGALRRNIIEVIALSVRYLTEAPSMTSEFFQAYAATISWPNVVSLVLLAIIGTALFRARNDVTGIHSKRVYRATLLLGVMSLGLGIAGLLSSPNHASAQQEQLRRTLNQRGHLEVQISGDNYEFSSRSQAADDSIRKQAALEQIRGFNISKAYRQLKNMNRDGYVTEIRAINPKDDCTFYVERRLETTLDKVVDANASCLRSDQTIYYLNSKMQPIKAPIWHIKQAAYMTNALLQKTHTDTSQIVQVVILLDGEADQYIARSNSEKLVPKGQPSTGVQSCGIDWQDTCPTIGLIDIFMNAEHKMTSGIGSAVAGDSLRPQSNASAEMFGTLTAMNDSQLQLTTDSGTKLVVAWPSNVIDEFNRRGASEHQMSDGPLQVVIGDHITLRLYYKPGMNFERLSISDVGYIGLALKTTLPDPLTGEPYRKDLTRTEKY